MNDHSKELEEAAFKKVDQALARVKVVAAHQAAAQAVREKIAQLKELAGS